VHKIIGKARIEGTQAGFIVWVQTDKRAKAQLTDASDDYAVAQATADSIDRGRWIGRRKGRTLRVNDKQLTVD
jgi:Tfp pilus assembly protein PilP